MDYCIVGKKKGRRLRQGSMEVEDGLEKGKGKKGQMTSLERDKRPRANNASR